MPDQPHAFKVQPFVLSRDGSATRACSGPRGPRLRLSECPSPDTNGYGRTTARNATGRPGAETSRPSTSPAAVAAAAGNFGRKPEDLPWLYLDSAGVEFGPVSGWMMRDWLASGRFPVGMDLKVRLPEWDRHLPLNKLFLDLSSAFLLPPAWPDVYDDTVQQQDQLGLDRRILPPSMSRSSTRRLVTSPRNANQERGAPSSAAGGRFEATVRTAAAAAAAHEAAHAAGEAASVRWGSNGTFTSPSTARWRSPGSEVAGGTCGSLDLPAGRACGSAPAPLAQNVDWVLRVAQPAPMGSPIIQMPAKQAATSSRWENTVEVDEEGDGSDGVFPSTPRSWPSWVPT